MKKGTAILLICCVNSLLPAIGAGEGESLTVFSAASLTDVVGDLAEIYEGKTGRSVLISAASSSVLARQIAAGADADVYFTANPKWTEFLVDETLLLDSPDTRRTLCSNSLAIIAPAGSPIATGSESPSELLAGVQLLAMGDPEHVPAGGYAAEALKSLGLWDGLEAFVLPCADVRSALRAVESGDADRGIVYSTDAVSADVSVLSSLPTDSHSAILYEIALLTDSRENPAAVDFFELALGEEGRAVLENRGFLVGETDQ